MNDFVLSNKERVAIFKVLTEHKQTNFNTIAKETRLASNKLSYQLNLMKEKGFLEHEDALYSLSLEAQRLIPYFSQILKKEVGVLPVVLGIVKHEDHILLLKRKKMPYKDMWGLIGGKQINGETIPQTIEREVKEETGLDAKFERINAVVLEHVGEGDECKHSFLLIITTLQADSKEAQEQEEGAVEWFPLQDVIDAKIDDYIPSDIEMIKKYLDSSTHIEHLAFDEQTQTISRKL